MPVLTRTPVSLNKPKELMRAAGTLQVVSKASADGDYNLLMTLGGTDQHNYTLELNADEAAIVGRALGMKPVT